MSRTNEIAPTTPNSGSTWIDSQDPSFPERVSQAAWEADREVRDSKVSKFLRGIGLRKIVAKRAAVAYDEKREAYIGMHKRTHEEQVQEGVVDPILAAAKIDRDDVTSEGHYWTGKDSAVRVEKTTDGALMITTFTKADKSDAHPNGGSYMNSLVVGPNDEVRYPQAQASIFSEASTGESEAAWLGEHEPKVAEGDTVWNPNAEYEGIGAPSTVTFAEIPTSQQPYLQELDDGFADASRGIARVFTGPALAAIQSQ